VGVDQRDDDELVFAVVRLDQLREHGFIGAAAWAGLLGLDDCAVALVDVVELEGPAPVVHVAVSLEHIARNLEVVLARFYLLGHVHVPAQNVDATPGDRLVVGVLVFAQLLDFRGVGFDHWGLDWLLVVADARTDLLFVFGDHLLDDVGPGREREAQGLGGGLAVGHVDEHLLRESAAEVAELIEALLAFSEVLDVGDAEVGLVEFEEGEDAEAQGEREVLHGFEQLSHAQVLVLRLRGQQLLLERLGFVQQSLVHLLNGAPLFYWHCILSLR